MGLSFEPAQWPGVQTLTIPRYGPVRSLNVSIAASIALYEYARQWGSCVGHD